MYYTIKLISKYKTKMIWARWCVHDSRNLMANFGPGFVFLKENRGEGR